MMTLNKKILFVIGNVRVSNGVTSVIMNHYGKLLKAITVLSLFVFLTIYKNNFGKWRKLLCSPTREP